MRIFWQAVSLLPLLTLTSWAGVIIDDFTTPTSSATACAPPTGAPGTTAGPAAATNTLSGERTINAQVSALLRTSAGCSTLGTSGAGVLDITNAFGVFGQSTVTWDVPGSVNLSANDLFSIDLAITGSISPNDTVTFTTTFCSDDACVNFFRRIWSINGVVNTLQTYQFALSSFTATGAPTWNNITKASLVVNSGNASDLAIDNIRLDTSVPEPATLSLFATALAAFAVLRRR